MIRMGGSHVEPHWTLTSAPRTRHQPTSRASTGGREGVGAQCVSGGAGGGERRQCLHCASCVHPFPPQKHQPPSPPGRRCCWSCAGRWRWGPQCPPGARGAGAASPPQAVSTAQQRQPAWRGACRAPVCVRVCVWGGVGWGASCSCCACRGQGCRRWAGSHTFRPCPPPPPAWQHARWGACLAVAHGDGPPPKWRQQSKGLGAQRQLDATTSLRRASRAAGAGACDGDERRGGRRRAAVAKALKVVAGGVHTCARSERWQRSHIQTRGECGCDCARARPPSAPPPPPPSSPARCCCRTAPPGTRRSRPWGGQQAGGRPARLPQRSR